MLILLKLQSPTFVGYSFQGAGKYGAYEVFKYQYGEKLFPNANKTLVFLGASATAEFIADLFLCPFEAIKVRMQTTLPPYAPNLREGWSKIVSKEGFGGYVLYLSRSVSLRAHANVGVDYTKVSIRSGVARSLTRWSNSRLSNPPSLRSMRPSANQRNPITRYSKPVSRFWVVISLVSDVLLSPIPLVRPCPSSLSTPRI